MSRVKLFERIRQDNRREGLSILAVDDEDAGSPAHEAGRRFLVGDQGWREAFRLRESPVAA